MRIIVAGAGSVGIHLAKLLSAESLDVILMDPDRDKLNFSKNNLEMMTMNGTPTSLKDLSEVGVKDAELFIAVTPEESTNITACMLASNMGAKKTFARIDNYEYLLPKNREFFGKLGVNAMVYPEMVGGKRSGVGNKTSLDAPLVRALRWCNSTDRSKSEKQCQNSEYATEGVDITFQEISLSSH